MKFDSHTTGQRNRSSGTINRFSGAKKFLKPENRDWLWADFAKALSSGTLDLAEANLVVRRGGSMCPPELPSAEAFENPLAPNRKSGVKEERGVGRKAAMELVENFRRL
jgi:hypothetical protein